VLFREEDGDSPFGSYPAVIVPDTNEVAHCPPCSACVSNLTVPPFSAAAELNILWAVRLPPETLQDLLKALVAAGQVRVVKVGGRIVYRATG
jgi:hypothetical protein